MSKVGTYSVDDLTNVCDIKCYRETVKLIFPKKALDLICGIDIKTFLFFILSLCIREILKPILLQSVKTKMKCSIMLHFIRVYTICKGKEDLQAKEYNIFENYNSTTLDMYNGQS